MDHFNLGGCFYIDVSHGSSFIQINSQTGMRIRNQPGPATGSFYRRSKVIKILRPSWAFHAVRVLFCSALFMSLTTTAFGQELKQASAVLAAKISASQRKRVAVVDITDLCGNVSRFGRYLAEELSGELVGDANGFRVMDRAHLQAI